MPPVLISALPVAVLAGGALSPAAQALQSANNGFVLLCAALVLMMTPAFALFYAGFVRSRNVLNTMVMSFAAMALVSVLWVLFGYSLASPRAAAPWRHSLGVSSGRASAIGRRPMAMASSAMAPWRCFSSPSRSSRQP